jgi:Tfp pilus assembly protein PilE
MGQQQIILLVFALVCVAIAVSIGIYLFNAAAASSNLEAVTADLVHLASRAHKYYITPRGLGGGGRSFVNVTIGDLTQDPTNGNGTYSVVSANNSQMVLQGIGYRDGDSDGTKCTVQATVFTDSVHVVYINR